MHACALQGSTARRHTRLRGQAQAERCNGRRPRTATRGYIGDSTSVAAAHHPTCSGLFFCCLGSSATGSAASLPLPLPLAPAAPPLGPAPSPGPASLGLTIRIKSDIENGFRHSGHLQSTTFQQPTGKAHIGAHDTCAHRDSEQKQTAILSRTWLLEHSDFSPCDAGSCCAHTLPSERCSPGSACTHAHFRICRDEKKKPQTRQIHTQRRME